MRKWIERRRRTATQTPDLVGRQLVIKVLTSLSAQAIKRALEEAGFPWF